MSLGKKRLSRLHTQAEIDHKDKIVTKRNREQKHRRTKFNKEREVHKDKMDKILTHRGREQMHRQTTFLDILRGRFTKIKSLQRGAENRNRDEQSLTKRERFTKIKYLQRGEENRNTDGQSDAKVEKYSLSKV